MKKLLLGLISTITLISIAPKSYSQWSDYSFYGTSFSYSSRVKISSSTSACLVGYYNVGFNFYGRIYKTSNSGASITPVFSGGYTMQNLYFFDALNGIAVGESDTYKLLVCKTNDGGSTWSTNTITSFLSGYDITFVDSQKGFIGGDNGILTTTNGGNSWYKVTTSPGSSIGHISFPTSSTGYAISKSGGYVYKSIDGGNIWTDISTAFNYAYSVNSIHFIDNNTGFITPNTSNKLFKTTDGGASWNTVTISGFGNLYDVKFLNNTEGYVSGERSSSGGCIYKTTDGGNTWSLFRSTSGVFSYYGFDFKDNFCLAAGLGGYSRTTSFSSTAGINDFEFENSKINIYPNPSIGGTLNVNLDENIKSINVINSQGNKEVFYQKSFNTSFKGLLLVVINTDNKSYLEKIVVE